MRLASHRPGRQRAAMTLVEILIVLFIIVILVGLVTAAAIRTRESMQGNATDSTLTKVAGELNKQWKVVTQDANRESVPQNVVTLAGGDQRRARVIWLKMRLRQEFPTSYAEALNPIPPALLQANGGPLLVTDLPAKNVFKKALVKPSNNPNTESSACLLLALTQARGGVTWDAPATLGGGAIADTDGDGVPEMVNTWGTALYFVRVPIAAGAVWTQDLNPNGLVPGINDSQDPDGALTARQWVNQAWGATTLGALFGQIGHPVAANASWVNLNPFVASPGPDRTIGDNDDHFSYRLLKQGAGGQR